MRRTTHRRHIEFDALADITHERAEMDAPVRAHANPLRRGFHLITARDERHAIRRELHELERVDGIEDDGAPTTT